MNLRRHDEFLSFGAVVSVEYVVACKDRDPVSSGQVQSGFRLRVDCATHESLLPRASAGLRLLTFCPPGPLLRENCTWKWSTGEVGAIVTKKKDALLTFWKVGGVQGLDPILRVLELF